MHWRTIRRRARREGEKAKWLHDKIPFRELNWQVTSGGAFCITCPHSRLTPGLHSCNFWRAAIRAGEAGRKIPQSEARPASTRSGPMTAAISMTAAIALAAYGSQSCRRRGSLIRRQFGHCGHWCFVAPMTAMGRSAVVALDVGSNDRLALQAITGIDPFPLVEALRLNDRIAA